MQPGSLRIHAGCGTVYLKGYWNVDAAIPNVSFLAADRPDLVALNQTTVDHYYKHPVAREDIEAKTFEQKLIVVDEFVDIRQLPYPANSLQEIRAVQVFEHFTYQEGEALLNHWFTLLKPGGTLHLDIPDLDGTVEQYFKATNPSDKQWYLRLLFGNQKNEFSLHKAMYSPTMIRALLKKTGFKHLVFLPNIHFYPAFAVEARK